jgi:hypothetical protein
MTGLTTEMTWFRVHSDRVCPTASSGIRACQGVGVAGPPAGAGAEGVGAGAGRHGPTARGVAATARGGEWGAIVVVRPI